MKNWKLLGLLGIPIVILGGLWQAGKALWSVVRRPYDRCVPGNHMMLTKSGFTACREHGDNGLMT